jgi:hypothetical protein
MMKHNTGDIKV